MSDILPARPFVKWVGGKGGILAQLVPYFPKELPSRYCEPFVGGGAVYFAIGHLFKECVINDGNRELINAYTVIRDKVEELIPLLRLCPYEESFYLRLRHLDQTWGLENLSDVQRAARFICLLKTCFNGLYRVNGHNFFNTPFGKYERVLICDEARLKDCHRYLTDVPTTLTCEDYHSVIDVATPDTFVYFDPPYHPVSDTSHFTSYQSGSWDSFAQRGLHDVCKELDRKGVKFMLSNSAAPFINDLYSDFNLNYVKAPRSINSKGTGRSAIAEVVITNYDTYQGNASLLHPDWLKLRKGAACAHALAEDFASTCPPEESLGRFAQIFGEEAAAGSRVETVRATVKRRKGGDGTRKAELKALS